MDQEAIQPPNIEDQTTTSSVSNHTLQTFIPTKNMPALIGYYFAIFSFIPFLGFPLAIAGLILGVIGMKKFKANPTPGAKGHALFAIIFSGLMLLLHILFIAINIFTFIKYY